MGGGGGAMTITGGGGGPTIIPTGGGGIGGIATTLSQGGRDGISGKGTKGGVGNSDAFQRFYEICICLGLEI